MRERCTRTRDIKPKTQPPASGRFCCNETGDHRMTFLRCFVKWSREGGRQRERGGRGREVKANHCTIYFVQFSSCRKGKGEQSRCCIGTESRILSSGVEVSEYLGNFLLFISNLIHRLRSLRVWCSQFPFKYSFCCILWILMLYFDIHSVPDTS